MTRSRKGVSLLVLIALLAAVAGAAVGRAATATPAPSAPGPAGATAGQLQVIAEPQAGFTPFAKLIAGARHTVTLTIYELYDTTAEHDLAAAAARGVDVRVELNGGYYSSRDTKNAAAYAYLKAHGVHVGYTPSYFALTHQKTLTVDGTVAAIMTLNWDGLYSSTRDYAAIDRRPGDVKAILAAFDADAAGTKLTASSGSGDLVWSPGAQDAFTRAITGARHTIDVENEEMAYAPVTGDLCTAAQRGVRVRVVMTYDSGWRAAFAQLKGCGVQIRLYHGQTYYVHAKLLVSDGATALVSSQNFSTTSLEHNRELGIELTARPLVTGLEADFSADWAGAEPY